MTSQTSQLAQRGVARGVYSFFTATVASTIAYCCLRDPQTLAQKMANAAKVVAVGVVTGIASNGFLGFLERNVVVVRDFFVRKDREMMENHERLMAGHVPPTSVTTQHGRAITWSSSTPSYQSPDNSYQQRHEAEQSLHNMRVDQRNHAEHMKNYRHETRLAYGPRI